MHFLLPYACVLDFCFRYFIPSQHCIYLIGKQAKISLKLLHIGNQEHLAILRPLPTLHKPDFPSRLLANSISPIRM